MRFRLSLQRLCRFLGGGREVRQRGQLGLLAVEVLEDRTVPTIDFNPITGVLTVTGMASGDILTVEHASGDPRMHASIVGGDGEAKSFPVVQVRAVVMQAQQDDSTINLNIENDPFITGGMDLGTQTGHNVINVQATPFGGSKGTTITSGGQDQVNLGNQQHSVQDIRSAVTVTNPGNSTTLTVDDSGNVAGRNVILSVNTVTGFGRIDGLTLLPITYQENDLSALNIKGGSGRNTFLVHNTGLGRVPMETTINTGDGDDSVTVEATRGKLHVHGGTGVNTLVGASADDELWKITGPHAGTLTQAPFPPSYDAPIDFTEMDDLVGGNGDDTFRMADGATVRSIDGGGGTNTLDYSAYTTSVIVNLRTGSATGVSGGAADSVKRIQNVIGGNGGPVTGPDAVYNILVGNGRNVLTGGTGRRNLLIAGPTASTLYGGDQDDILIGGTTTWDTDIPTLQTRVEIWTQDLPFDERVGEIQTSGLTVMTNGGSNTLTGHTHQGGTEKDLYYGIPDGDAADVADNRPCDTFMNLSPPP
jgi:hypothetical protein